MLFLANFYGWDHEKILKLPAHWAKRYYEEKVKWFEEHPPICPMMGK